MSDVLRYPCACPIESGDDSCPHVDATINRLLGKRLAHLNDIALLELENADPLENDS